MMRVIIKTAIKRVRSIIDVLNKDMNFEVAAITDNNVEKWDSEINGVQVFSPFRSIQLYKNGEVDAIVIPAVLGYNKIRIIEQELINFGYKKEDIFVFCERGVSNNLIQIDEYAALDYIEFHVSHKCNLNCKACCHFSSISAKDFPDYSEWKEGITQLKKRIPHINNIRLLGGEPLLNPELERYIVQTRLLYPESNVVIVSNGILIRQMNEELIKCLRENNVKIDISVYPAMHKKMEEILRYLKEIDLLAGVLYSFEFSKMITKEKREFPYISTENICTCPNLIGTKLAPCPLIAYISDFNDKFQEDFEYEDGFVSLLDERLTGKQLLEELHRPKKLCDYCRAYMADNMIEQIDSRWNKWMAYDSETIPKSSDWILETSV